MAFRDVLVVLGDDDLAPAHAVAEIPEQWLAEAEAERASVARIDRLEAAVGFALVAAQGDRDRPPVGIACRRMRTGRLDWLVTFSAASMKE